MKQRLSKSASLQRTHNWRNVINLKLVLQLKWNISWITKRHLRKAFVQFRSLAEFYFGFQCSLNHSLPSCCTPHYWSGLKYPPEYKYTLAFLGLYSATGSSNNRTYLRVIWSLAPIKPIKRKTMTQKGAVLHNSNLYLTNCCTFWHKCPKKSKLCSNPLMTPLKYGDRVLSFQLILYLNVLKVMLDLRYAQRKVYFLNFHRH